MADFELLKGRAGDSRYLAFRPPLNEDQYFRVASAMGLQPEENAFVTSQVDCTTEFVWPDTPFVLDDEKLEANSREAIVVLGRLGYSAELIDSNTVSLDGPDDLFTQFENQHYAAH